MLLTLAVSRHRQPANIESFPVGRYSHDQRWVIDSNTFFMSPLPSSPIISPFSSGFAKHSLMYCPKYGRTNPKAN